MQENIFDPLAVNDSTVFDGPMPQFNNKAISYEDNADGT
jgi:hypothetical protein